MHRSLIIGYGNTLRGDDGLGPYVIEQLFMIAEDELAGRVKLLALPQLDIALIAEMSKITSLIFIDARRDENDEPLKVEEMKAGNQASQSVHTSHSVGISGLLRLAADWYGAAPVCYAVLPKGYDFCIREGLSDRARIAADLAIKRVLAIIQGQN